MNFSFAKPAKRQERTILIIGFKLFIFSFSRDVENIICCWTVHQYFHIREDEIAGWRGRGRGVLYYLYYCTGWRRLTTCTIVLGGEGWLPILLYWVEKVYLYYCTRWRRFIFHISYFYSTTKHEIIQIKKSQFTM